MKLIMVKASLLAASIALVGCSSTNETAEAPAASDSKSQYEAALASAEAAVDKAASVGGEWRDIRHKKSKVKYLPSAKKAAEAGDYDKAMKLLEIVQFQAEAGYQQAMDQKNAGPRF